MSIVWLVGQYKSGGHDDEPTAWDFAGVFDSEEKAIAACRDETYWIGPAVMNRTLPHDETVWDGGCYPLLQDRPDDAIAKLDEIAVRFGRAWFDSMEERSGEK